MPSIFETISKAVEHHQAGRLAEAEKAYRQILAVEPNHVDALHLLGVVVYQIDQREEAIDWIQRAISLKGTEAAFHNNLGKVLKGCRRWDQAIAAYRRAIELQPNFAEAHYNLGSLLAEQGLREEAIACFRTVLEHKPNNQAALQKLGHALFLQGEISAAADCCRHVLKLLPSDPNAINLMGVHLKTQGRFDEAIVCYRYALELQPDFLEVHYNLGNVLREQGKLQEAIDEYQRVIATKPSFIDAYNNLGNAFVATGNFAEAIATFRRALQEKPNDINTLNSLGTTLIDCDELTEAAQCFHQALNAYPDSALSHNNLGGAMKKLGHVDEAIVHFRRALVLDPDYEGALMNLGAALWELGKRDEAVVYFRRALELNPKLAIAHFNLGVVAKDQGRPEEAIECYRRAIELKPNYIEANCNLLFVLQLYSGANLAELRTAHAEYNRRHAAHLRPKTPPQKSARDSRQPLRVGFVSPDFGRHPIGYFLVQLLEKIDRQKVQTYCYSDRVHKDEMTDRLQTAASEWRDVKRLSDEQLAEKIRSDRIDILFDLAGHTANNRLQVFARKPAPIQITWIGYMCTTGIVGMDYLLADRFEVPPSAEPFFSERIVRMPDGHICYEPPAYAPEVSPLPALEKGYVTFGCFNNPVKITPQMLAVWARILQRVPNSRLVLKYTGLDDPQIIQSYMNTFSQYNIGAERLEFKGSSPHAELMQAYQHIDIALDSFPYTGCLTTCEALWMGAPVISFPGETMTSRQAYSCIANSGLTGTIARNLDDYVEIAVSLARDLPKLAELRAGMRPQMASSPLCDGPRFTSNFVSLLQDIWKQHPYADHS